MPQPPDPIVPEKGHPLVRGAILIAASLAYPTWRFGPGFLRQFWISPFQFFILPLWLLAYVSDRTGVMPVRSGPPCRRDQDPRAFRQHVWACILFGAAMFAFNLWISWKVVSRRPRTPGVSAGSADRTLTSQ